MNRELKNGLYHALGAIAALAPAAAFPTNPVAWLYAGLCYGLVREVTEEGSPVTAEKIFDAFTSWRDLLGWTIGGLILGIAVALR